MMDNQVVVIIIKDSYTTIILNKEDAQDVIAFLER